jgi:hypothetical protein
VKNIVEETPSDFGYSITVNAPRGTQYVLEKRM